MPEGWATLLIKTMVIKRFPPVEYAGPEGLLAIGGDLDLNTLKLAYSEGIFPWPTEEFPLLWFSPPKRAILDFTRLKVPKRYQRERRAYQFHFKIDKQFSRVIHACAEGLTRNSSGTWITPELIKAYIGLHKEGFAHSFECYNIQDQLVGGLYGVSIGQMFAGESMFYWESGASKEAFLYACEYLKKRGATWLDVQMLSPLLESFGAREVPRDRFIKKLKSALKKPPMF